MDLFMMIPSPYKYIDVSVQCTSCLLH